MEFVHVNAPLGSGRLCAGSNVEAISVPQAMRRPCSRQEDIRLKKNILAKGAEEMAKEGVKWSRRC